MGKMVRLGAGGNEKMKYMLEGDGKRLLTAENLGGHDDFQRIWRFPKMFWFPVAIIFQATPMI